MTPSTALQALDVLRFELDRRQLAIAVVLLAIPVVVFTVSDVLTAYARPGLLGLLLGIRIVSLAVVLLGVRRMMQVKERQRFARVLTVACYVIVGLALTIHALRPPEALSPYFFELLLLFALYAVVPSRWRQQAGPALALTIGSLVLLATHHQAAELVDRIAIVTILLAANAVGLSLGWSRTLAERREEEFVESERLAREALLRTTGELQTLRGILPICAHCRKVRDEAGAWAALEAYVRRHSPAEFSHGICPDCVAEYFPTEATASA